MNKILITGGSEGIGYALAMQYGKEGYSVILAARNLEKLKNAAANLEKQGIPCEVCSVDLSKKEDRIRLCETYKRDTDILVNNAGIGYTGRALEMSEEKDRFLVGVNVIAVMELSKEFAKEMCKKKKGLIINLSSTGAYQPGPYIASYYASKSFVLSYSRALNEEMKEYGVHVCSVCPGPVDTRFYAKSGGKRPEIYMTSKQIAEITYRKAMRKTVIIPGIFNKLAFLIPTGIRMKMVKRMKKKNLNS